jgi:THO complex subunit 4
VVVGAALAADLIPPAKTLTERISQPKAQPRSAAAEKKTDGATKTGAVGTRGRGNRGRRGGRNPRPSKKTTEELDSEMADYFNGTVNTAEGAAPAATGAANGDAAMDDGILVCITCASYLLGVCS